MTSIITTQVTSVVPTTERPATVSCLLGGGSSLPVGSLLCVTGVFAGTDAEWTVSERPTQAPVANAARIFGYAAAANGAGHGVLRAMGEATVVKQHDPKMRAFRGLEPWRDPA